MKKTLIAIAAILLFSISFAGNTEHVKVTICHRTGNGGSHEITVDSHAVPAHLAHGDSIGECDGGPGGG